MRLDFFSLYLLLSTPVPATTTAAATETRKRSQRKSHGCNYVHSWRMECVYVILQIIAWYSIHGWTDGWMECVGMVAVATNIGFGCSKSAGFEFVLPRNKTSFPGVDEWCFQCSAEDVKVISMENWTFRSGTGMQVCYRCRFMNGEYKRSGWNRHGVSHSSFTR